MENMEIEKKFLLKGNPFDLEKFQYHYIEQGYLCQSPVVRIRRSDDEYYMTYKGKGMMARTEYNLPLTKKAYEHLIPKADGNIIKKTRYIIPLNINDDMFPQIPHDTLCKLANEIKLNIELDVFDYPANLIMAEIEFPNLELAEHFNMPDYFSQEVTNDPKYHNVNMIWADNNF